MSKILFVEDEQDHINMLQPRIESLGHEFFFATDGEAGWEQVCRVKPDLILMDLIMPRLNGYELCCRIKEHDDTKEIPIIIVTASGAKELEQKCIALGVREILHKPYDSAYMIERIDHYLDQ